jgi:hypothetical protein
LKEWIETLRPFLFWPLPYSKIAKQVMMKLHQETLAPGSAMLEWIVEESRSPELNTFEEDNAHPIQR